VLLKILKVKVAQAFQPVQVMTHSGSFLSSHSCDKIDLKGLITTFANYPAGPEVIQTGQAESILFL